MSLGGAARAIALALEQRFATAVLWSGGFRSNRPSRKSTRSISRHACKLPMLMLNGRDDFTFPIETAQVPMFTLLGTPDGRQDATLYDGGHVFPFARIMKDSLEWLDKYLGAVK